MNGCGFEMNWAFASGLKGVFRVFGVFEPRLKSVTGWSVSDFVLNSVNTSKRKMNPTPNAMMIPKF